MTSCFGNVLLGFIIFRIDLAWLYSLRFLIRGPQVLAQQYVRFSVGCRAYLPKADDMPREQEFRIASEHLKAVMS